MIDVIFREKHFSFWTSCFVDYSIGFASIDSNLDFQPQDLLILPELLSLNPVLILMLTRISVVEMKRLYGI